MQTEIELLTRDNAESQAPILAARATQLALGIQDEATFKQAAEYVVTLKGAIKKWDSIIGPMCDAARKSWQEANALRSKVEDPLKNAIANILTPRMSSFRQAQERRRQAEEDRLAAEAKKRAEDEALENAQELHNAGFAKEAEAMIAAPVAVATPVVPKAEKVAGLSERQIWSAEVVSKMGLVKAVAAGTVPLVALDANMPFLNSQAKSMKAEMHIPGVKATPRTSFAGQG